MNYRLQADGKEPTKDLKLIRNRQEVKSIMAEFWPKNIEMRNQLLHKLRDLKDKFEKSEFFRTHEVIGSSLLFIYDEQKVGIWMIDFAKTVKLAENVTVDHKSHWSLGNHEDGYLIGLNNLIEMTQELFEH